MKKLLIILLVVFGIVMSGFSKQYVKVYCIENRYQTVEDVVTKGIQEELMKGSSVVSMAPLITQSGYGSETYGCIVVFDDGKSEVNNETGTR